MLQHWQLVSLLWSALFDLSMGNGCVYKECTCVDQYIHCEESELSRMPELIPSSQLYSTLDLSINSITDIPAGSFPPILTTVYLTNNPITTIADTAFDDSASTLETLILSSVRFPRIPNAFSHLGALTTLAMQYAHIQDWNEEAMKNIGHTLELLDLESVGLTSWPTWLQHFTRLTELTLSGGFLSSVPDDALDNVTNTLTSLNLSNNTLTIVPKAFSKFTVLEKLFLQQNRITDVTYLPHASKLLTLSLPNNLISDVHNLSLALLPFNASLDFLDISANRLTSIPNITFLTLLGPLNFTSNRLSDPYSGAVAPEVPGIIFSYNFLPAIPPILKTLQWIPEMTLISNSIKQIQASDFPNTTQLVELGYNLITELTDNSFPANSSISTLNLNNNPITQISNEAFKNLAKLGSLNLQGTRLTRLPLALASLTGLSTLDLTDNVNLVCTCQEKGLEHWMITVVGLAALGNCGIMDIYQFFLELIPSC